jgi:shikimate kinase
MRIYLIGYMASGKSTISVRLAKAIGFTRIDMDELFEERYKISVSDFFAKYGQEAFRQLESQLLKETENIDHAVISCGGGTPCFYDNMYWMNQHGITVYLSLPAEVIVNRLQNSRKKRPLIASKTADELPVFVKEQLRRRNIYYSQARIVFPAVSAEISKLVELVEGFARFNKPQMPDSL